MGREPSSGVHYKGRPLMFHLHHTSLVTTVAFLVPVHSCSSTFLSSFAAPNFRGPQIKGNTVGAYIFSWELFIFRITVSLSVLLNRSIIGTGPNYRWLGRASTTLTSSCIIVPITFQRVHLCGNATWSGANLVQSTNDMISYFVTLLRV